MSPVELGKSSDPCVHPEPQYHRPRKEERVSGSQPEAQLGDFGVWWPLTEATGFHSGWPRLSQQYWKCSDNEQDSGNN